MSGDKMDALRQDILKEINGLMNLIDHKHNSLLNNIYYNDLVSIMLEVKAVQDIKISLTD